MAKPMLQELVVGGIGKITNRFAMAPMTRARAPKGTPNDLMREYYTQRASTGLLITEGTHVGPYAVGWVDAPGIYTEEHVAEWKKITDSVHEAGGKIVVQLWHQGRQSHEDFHDGKAPIAPSAVKCDGELVTPKGRTTFPVPRAMELEDIKTAIAEFGKSTALAKEAGFDGVEIHGANGYLLDQFLQSKSNLREDDYGGSIENRHRFVSEVVNACIDNWSADRVGIRLSPNGVYGSMGSPEFREQFTYTIEELAKLNLAYIHLVDGLAFGFHELGEPLLLQEGKAIIEKVQGAERKTMIIGSCGYSFETADKAISEGYGDIIALGRPYISNPDIPELYAKGEAMRDVYGMQYWWSANVGAPGYTEAPPAEATAEE